MAEENQQAITEENPITQAAEEPTHVLVPLNLFAQARQIIGQLPHDQVAAITRQLDGCQGVSNPVFRPPPGANGSGEA